MAFPLTTVECERDFSWLQDLLNEKRVNMSNLMTGAYVLGKKAPSFLRVAKTPLKSVRKKRKLPTENELGNKMVTSCFKPKSAKKVVVADDEVGKADAQALSADDEALPSDVEAVDDVGSETDAQQSTTSSSVNTYQVAEPVLRRSSRQPKPSAYEEMINAFIAKENAETSTPVEIAAREVEQPYEVPEVQEHVEAGSDGTSVSDEEDHAASPARSSSDENEESSEDEDEESDSECD